MSKQAELYRKKLGKQIKALRKAQKVSQAQLAFEAGVRREAIVHIEKGEQNATVDTLHSIAGALNVPIKEFFDFE